MIASSLVASALAFAAVLMRTALLAMRHLRLTSLERQMSKSLLNAIEAERI
jgi:hypothetical protein